MNAEELRKKIELLAAELRGLEKLIPEYEKIDWLKAAMARNKYNNLDKECLDAIQYLKSMEVQ